MSGATKSDRECEHKPMSRPRIQRQKLMFELLEAHPLMMASMLNWASMRPGPLQRWSEYVWEVRFDPMQRMFGHLWADPNSAFCKAFEPVTAVCRQILDILTRVAEPIQTATKQFIEDFNEPIVTPAPATCPPLGEGEFDVNRGSNKPKDPDAAPPIPLKHIIAYFEQLLEDAELEGAVNRGEFDNYYENRLDRIEATERASWVNPPSPYSPIRSPEPALPEPKPPPLPNVSEIHDRAADHTIDYTMRSIGDPILDLQIEECIEIVNGLIVNDKAIPPPDR